MLVLLCSCNTEQNNKTNSLSTNTNPYHKQVDSILNLMTLEEKLGQLNLLSLGEVSTGQAKNTHIRKKIEEGKVGGLLNITSVKRILEVQKIAVEKTRLKIPLIIGMDVIHGYKTIFPIPIALSSSWNMDIIKQTARVAAQEATADGINWTFSPMVDVSRDPRWGRMAEGAGEDPYLGSLVAKAMVEGYQGNSLEEDNTLMACVKHFALYGAPEAGRDYNTVDMSRIRMFNEYLAPYQAAVDAGVGSVMTAFNEVDGVPATANHWLFTELLRNNWGFNGFVVTDYTSINEMIAHGMGDLQQASALALKAGIDMDMVGEGMLTTLEKSLKEKKVTLNEIDIAVKRILTAKFQLGLFKDPYKYCNLERAEKEIFTKENREFSRKVATESMVLLKNAGNVLPLKKEGTIALVGPLANTAVNMGGTWSVTADQEKSISLLNGLKNVINNQGKILYAKGSNLHHDLKFEENTTVFGNLFKKPIPRDGRTNQELLNEAVQIAKQSDVVIAALGESAEMSGEGSSRTNIEIPQVQKDLLQALLETGKPVVLVLFTGRPLVLLEESKTVPAILNVWFPGSEAGLAISDVLFGDANPSGKLTATFPRNAGQIPIFYNHKNTGRPISEEKTKHCEFQKFRSCYLDACNTPLYPFGYGLSYTTFKYNTIKLSSNKMTTSNTITASVDVSNVGNYDGKEIVQLYIRDLVGSVTRPVKELKGFQKVELKKGETKTVTFDISIDDLKFYNTNLEFVAEPGTFQVFLGANSETKNSVEFQLEMN